EVLDKNLRDKFETLLEQVGIDLEYDRFLKEYSGKNDVFGIVIDRDFNTHSVSQMKSIVQQCQEKNYYCFITNPCIEFWLLMHLVDIRNEYKEQIQDFRDNKRVSKKHTFTSREVSKRAGHSKGISDDIFKSFYLHRVDFAIQQAKESFTTDINGLIGMEESDDDKKGELGSNLPALFDLLREI
ncbi:MAG: RloB domain-containing protein, partial [Acetatifactor sp.]